MTSVPTLFAALLLDRLLGEPARWHPLVGFGRLARWLESRIHADSVPRGLLATALLLTPPTALAVWAAGASWRPAIELAALYLALGARSLEEHAEAVRTALEAGELEAARAAVARLVSRDVDALGATEIAGAAVESVLENGNDAVFGALFWFLAAGAPGVLCYRLANTLDAMWGYRTPRYANFGKAAARLDDLLNWVPARLTALSYALMGETGRALSCWRRQAREWKSPNAGVVMAAGAGALGIRLGGPARYHGQRACRPLLGDGRPPRAADIGRAQHLVRRALLPWILAAVLLEWFPHAAA